MDRGLFGILCFFSFWMGACIASFLNVVIWRVPRGESIVSPPSHCPKCGAAIRWYQNIPILSWLALRGRCAACRTPISPRYILVETLGGVLFLGLFLRFGLSYVTPFMWTWAALMIAGSFIDYDHKLLPDFVTVGGMVLGLVMGGVASAVEHSWAAILWSGIGLAFGFGLLWLVRFLGGLAFKREAMGMGDVFLLGAIGALFGPISVVVTLILSSVLGSVGGLSLMLLSKARRGRFVEIPYGPYICLACLADIFAGDWLVTWYLGMFR